MGKTEKEYGEKGWKGQMTKNSHWDNHHKSFCIMYSDRQKSAIGMLSLNKQTLQ